MRGPAGLKQWIGGSVGAFTDYSFTTTVGPLVDEDKVAGRWVFRATYQGGMPGASSAAVGKRVEYAGMALSTVNESRYRVGTRFYRVRRFIAVYQDEARQQAR